MQPTGRGGPKLHAGAELLEAKQLGIKHFELKNRSRGGAEIVGSDVWITLAATTAVTAQHRVRTDAGKNYIAQQIAEDAVIERKALLGPYLDEGSAA